MPWTDQQTDAIEARGRSIIVSAAAGSGKTAVLVERLLRILSDTQNKIPADRMIVVTFTNDAAAQMKQRLTNALTEKLTQLAGQEDSEAYQWLFNQRISLSSAKISTIHSFCFDLLRENGESLGISPLFTVAEPGQETIYQRTALERVMEHWTSEVPEMQQLFAYFCAKDDSDVEKLVLKLADHLGSVAFPKQWIRDAKRAVEDSEALFSQMRDSICAELRELIALYTAGVPFADHALTAVDPKKGNAFRRKLDTDLAALQAQLDYLEQESVETICNAPLARSAVFQKSPALRSNLDAENKQAFQQIAEIVKKRYEKLLTDQLAPLAFFREDARISAEVIPPLLDLTQEYLDTLLQEKLANNVLSFSDAEEQALRLLAQVDDEGHLTRSPLAVQLSAQYDLIMVDEYQDTNNKQDCIFKLLSHDCVLDGQRLHYGDNAFLVGDVKQSIYSFRQANPENFREMIADSTPLADCTGRETARIYLNRNFRSALGVLGFVNGLFSALMRDDCGEVHYDENEQLNFGASLYEDLPDKTEILLARESDALPEEYDLQAECVADTIASMLRTATVRIRDKNGTQAERQAEPGDFCILLRSVSGDGAPFMEALERRGIPYSADADGGLLELPEIRLIRNFLRITDNPMTDAPMAAVLLSPVYSFTVEDLAQLKLFSAKRRIMQQMKELAECEELPDTLTELQARVQAFLSDLHSMKENAGRLPLEEAIWEIFYLTDLLSLQSLYQDAAERRSHLEAFARLAKEYRDHAALTSEGCLTGWLRYLDRLEAGGKSLEIRGGSQGHGCVQIKTIHKSKGLEFPFVFVAKLEHRFSKNPSRSPLQAGMNGLVGVRIYDREKCTKAATAAYRALLADVYRRQRSEEMRLFYVALTRAEQQLFLVMDHPEGGKLSAGRMGTLLEYSPQIVSRLAPYADSMLDWVLYFLLTSRDAEHMRRLMEGTPSTGHFASYRIWQYTANETAAVQEQILCTAAPDADALSRMRAQIHPSYETAQSALPSKVTVTQLAHPETGAYDLLRRPAFMLDGKTGGLANLKGAARGTAVHKIMQLIDFALASRDAQAALDALHQAGSITDAEAASITAEKLAAFFASPIYKRIEQADIVERERNIFVKLGTLQVQETDQQITAPYRGTSGVLIGTMDLIFHEADGWVILDYKTDYATSGTTLIKEYALQLRLYRAAAEQLLGAGERIKGLYLYSFALDRELEIQSSQREETP